MITLTVFFFVDPWPASWQGVVKYCDNYLFDRDFPLGVEERVTLEPWRVAVAHSGVPEVGHSPNSAVSFGVYGAMAFVIVGGGASMVRSGGKRDVGAESRNPRLRGRREDAGLAVARPHALQDQRVVGGDREDLAEAAPQLSRIWRR